MPAPNIISAEKLSRLIGRPDGPVIVDVCTDEDFALDPRLVPGAVRRSHRDVAAWAPEFRRALGRRRVPERPQTQPGRGGVAAA
jgi:hypothetical protein